MHRTLDVVCCACSCKGSRLNIHHILELVLHAQQQKSRSRIYRSVDVSAAYAAAQELGQGQEQT